MKKLQDDPGAGCLSGGHSDEQLPRLRAGDSYVVRLRLTPLSDLPPSKLGGFLPLYHPIKIVYSVLDCLPVFDTECIS